MDFHEYHETKNKNCKVCKELFAEYKNSDAQPVNDPKYYHTIEPMLKRKKSRSSITKSRSKSKSKSRSKSKDAKKPRVRRRSLSKERNSRSKSSNRSRSISRPSLSSTRSRSISRPSLSSTRSRSKSRSNLSSRGFDVNISDLHNQDPTKLRIKKKYRKKAAPASQADWYEW